MFSKDTTFPDAPIIDPSTPWQQARELMVNGPNLHEYLKEMTRESFAKHKFVYVS